MNPQEIQDKEIYNKALRHIIMQNNYTIETLSFKVCQEFYKEKNELQTKNNRHK